jgi:hypothetical protein
MYFDRLLRIYNIYFTIYEISLETKRITAFKLINRNSYNMISGQIKRYVAPKHLELAKNWYVGLAEWRFLDNCPVFDYSTRWKSAASFGVAASMVGIWIADWKRVVLMIPFYRGKFETST